MADKPSPARQLPETQLGRAQTVRGLQIRDIRHKMNNQCKEGNRFVISGKQRNLLYEHIFRHLAGIDAVWLAASSGEFQKADRLSHILCQELTLVMDDLGWGTQSNDSVELSTSPHIVRNVLERLRSEAKVLDPEIDVREAAADNRELITTCDQLLAALDSRESGHGSAGRADEPVAGFGEGELAQRLILEEVLEKGPAHVAQTAVIRAIRDQWDRLPEEALLQALEELLDLKLLVRHGPESIAASEGLLRVNRLWDGLWQVI